MFPSPARKNPGIDKVSFEALERRVAALEAIIGPIVATDDAQEVEPARRGRKPKSQED